jgi:hypothetical protein
VAFLLGFVRRARNAQLAHAETEKSRFITAIEVAHQSFLGHTNPSQARAADFDSLT